jgi:hypothetical protein
MNGYSVEDNIYLFCTGIASVAGLYLVLQIPVPYRDSVPGTILSLLAICGAWNFGKTIADIILVEIKERKQENNIKQNYGKRNKSKN